MFPGSLTMMSLYNGPIQLACFVFPIGHLQDGVIILSTSGFSFLVVLLFDTTRVSKLNCYIAGHIFPTAHALIGYFEVT